MAHVVERRKSAASAMVGVGEPRKGAGDCSGLCGRAHAAAAVDDVGECRKCAAAAVADVGEHKKCAATAVANFGELRKCAAFDCSNSCW